MKQETQVAVWTQRWLKFSAGKRHHILQEMISYISDRIEGNTRWWVEISVAYL